MVKQATKGQKEIYEENLGTIKAYGTASLVSAALYFVGCQLAWECNSTAWIFYILTALIQGISVFFMKSMAVAKFDEKGHVVDAGMDLNDPSAFGEYCKDSVILTVIVQVLALYTNYAYFLLLALPGAIGYKFIVSFLLPWVFAPSAGGNEDADEKKLRKKERKIVYRR